MVSASIFRVKPSYNQTAAQTSSHDRNRFLVHAFKRVLAVCRHRRWFTTLEIDYVYILVFSRDRDGGDRRTSSSAVHLPGAGQAGGAFHSCPACDGACSDG